MLNANPSRIYDNRFFAGHVDESLRSARAVVPAICRMFNPQSVVDLGCGLGAWLRAFAESGVGQICGVDGSHVDPDNLLIPKQKFLPRDFRQPFDIPGRYDLAVCIEVAEHLRAKAGEHLVYVLCKSAPLVLFSAAIPGQGGSYHINEQWPEYWRSLFAARGFQLFDPIRPRIRDDSSIRWWYRQNLLVFANREAILAHPALLQEVPVGEELQWVHISIVRHTRDIRAFLRNLPGVPWTWSYLKPLLRSRTYHVNNPSSQPQ